ncbi:MAG: hypothetical protein IJ033_03100 [Clostridia bacterium]|nr:hypothetical protein [Clostridia bacterium]
MKKFSKILLITLLVMVLVTALVACKEEDTHKGEFTHTINNVDDLKKISEMLGSDYDQGIFELKADLTISDENWAPIGTSVDSSFRGTFVGNGHTITYKINIDEPLERDTTATVPDEKFYGIFGVVHGATISNLNVYVDIAIPADASSNYVGGLVGFMSGDCNISNVNVSGNIATTMGNLCRFIPQEDGSELRELERYSMAGYIGGLAGYAKGNSKISNVNSSVSINVGAYNDGAYVSALNDVFVGGIVGSMRPINLSSLKDNNAVCSAKNLTYTGMINAKGNLVNAGGIFGAAYRINDGEKWVVNSSKVTASACKRLRVGGVAGIIDRVNLNKTSAKVSQISAETFSSSASRSFNVGGLVGYVANFSAIENAIIAVDKISVAVNVNNYTGGLVGMLHFSSIKNAVADGTLYYGRDSILTISTISYAGNTRNNAYYTYNGGIVGRVYGESTLDNLSTKFTAYQGIVGELANAVEIVNIKEGEGETYEGWLGNTVYKSSQISVNKEGALEDGEQKYRVIHNYDISANNYTYISTNSRCNNDIPQYPNATERLVEVGSGVADSTSYDALYNSINSAINA